MRIRIDEVDNQILSLLGERAKLCKAIGKTKKANGKPVRDADRENQVYKCVREKARDFGLDPAQVESVYHEIVNMCSSVQE